MAARDSAAVLTAIVKTGSAIRDLVNTGYKVSAEFQDFQQKMSQLIQERTFWEAQIVKFGLSDDPELLDSFRNAESILERERTKLCKRKAKMDESWCGGCWLKLKMVLFPSELEQTIVKVSKVFDNVLGGLKRKKDIAEECQGMVGMMKPSLGFRMDRRYIPLKETEEKVMTILRSADCPGHALVLLHGFSGSGKSSLARNVALQVEGAIQRREMQRIEEIARKRDSKLAGLPGTSNSPTDFLKSTSLVFDQVIYLECGPGVDLQAKQLELREKLGWNPAKLGNCEGDTVEQSESEAMVKSSLSRLLKERSLLIILDDVWNPSSECNPSRSHFLQVMIDLGGDNVKWLITSQSADLCEGLNLNLSFFSIQMENINSDVARQILAVHIGLPGEDIPSEVQQFMDEIISKVDANPLAITCIAPAIDPERVADEAEWEKVLENLASNLRRSAQKCIQSTAYGRSCWEAIELGFDRLTKQHQNVLILMAMCKGPSVPEEIIQFFYEESKDPKAFETFSEARRDLQGRHLVRIAITSDGKGRKGIRAWSIHALIKEFVVKKYVLPRDDNTALFRRFVNGDMTSNPDSKVKIRVLSTLAALYFAMEFRMEFIRHGSLDIMFDKLSDVRRRVIEPIARLLVLNANGKWTPTLHSCTRKIFLEYVRDGLFDEESASILLQSGPYAVPMIDALQQFSRTKEYSFVGKRMISSLVRLLENTTTLDTSRRQNLDFQLLRDVCLVIGHLVHENVHNSSVKVLVEGGSFTKVFRQLANLLTRSNLGQDSRTQELVVEAIGYLAYSCQVIVVELSNAPGLQEGLVKAFFQDDNHNCQAEVLIALGHLGYHNDSFIVKLIDILGMLERLVKALKIDDHDLLQTRAAYLFSRLTSSYYMGLKVVNCPGALEALVNGLGRDANNRLQEKCANTLWFLADLSDDMRVRLVRFPMLIQKLVGALGKGDVDNVALKRNAGLILGSLALGYDETRSEMLNSRDLVEKLVDAAIKDDNDGSAIYALTCLCPEIGKEIRLRCTKAYARRGRAKTILGFYQEALEDLNEACRLGPPWRQTFRKAMSSSDKSSSERWGEGYVHPIREEENVTTT